MTSVHISSRNIDLRKSNMYGARLSVKGDVDGEGNPLPPNERVVFVAKKECDVKARINYNFYGTKETTNVYIPKEGVEYLRGIYINKSTMFYQTKKTGKGVILSVECYGKNTLKELFTNATESKYPLVYAKRIDGLRVSTKTNEFEVLSTFKPFTEILEEIKVNFSMDKIPEIEKEMRVLEIHVENREDFLKYAQKTLEQARIYSKMDIAGRIRSDIRSKKSECKEKQKAIQVIKWFNEGKITVEQIFDFIGYRYTTLRDFDKLQRTISQPKGALRIWQEKDFPKGRRYDYMEKDTTRERLIYYLQKEYTKTIGGYRNRKWEYKSPNMGIEILLDGVWQEWTLSKTQTVFASLREDVLRDY